MAQVRLSKEQFAAQFPEAHKALCVSEATSKDLIQVWANHVLAHVHEFGNSNFLNTFCKGLSPVNLRAVREFFKTFSGYTFNEEELVFEGKSKKYLTYKQKWDESIADDTFNIWTWQKKHLTVERAPFAADDVAKRAGRLFNEAHKANISKADILKGILSAKLTAKDKGAFFSVADLVEALQAMDGQQASDAANKVATIGLVAA